MSRARTCPFCGDKCARGARACRRHIHLLGLPNARRRVRVVSR